MKIKPNQTNQPSNPLQWNPWKLCNFVFLKVEEAPLCIYALCINHISFMHLAIDGYLGLLYPWILINAIINVNVNLCGILHFLHCVPRCGKVESYSICSFIFLRNNHINIYSCCISLYSHKQRIHLSHC